MPYKDPAAAKARRKRYYWDHREHELATNRTFKNRARSRGGDGVSPEQWTSLCVLWKGCCAHCGVLVGKADLTRDHLIPLSRGGLDDVLNVVPACRKCNRAHGTKLMCEWKPGSFLCACPSCVKEGQCSPMVDCACPRCQPLEEDQEAAE
jgi:5-methylcytosine-specific restriction endonuclease McrA